MRVAVLGAGGIGGYYGARLAKAGHDVVFIARGAHLEAMQERGLTVLTPEGESTRSIVPLVASDTTVLTVQNGVDNVVAIASVVGTGAVLAGAVYAALQIAEPGVIARTGAEARIAFGEPGGAVTARTTRIAAAFEQSGIAYQVSPDIDRILWEKFLFITGVGGVTALARSGIGALVSSPEGRALLAASCE